MKIKHKLEITTIGLSMIILGMFFATWWITGKQKTDGLMINLAGRQRMLSQKMTKEIIFFQMEKIRTGRINADTAAGIRNTMKVFDTTLSALKDSGDAPLSLNLKDTEYRWCPKANDPAFSQLKKVKLLWDKFSEHIEAVLNNPEAAEDGFNWVLNNNLSLLKEMNAAVVMMQKQSEARVGALLEIQIGGMLIGIVFMTLTMGTVLSLVKRLDRIKYFAGRLGTGDFTVLSGLKSVDELGLIGKDLDEMTANLKGMFSAVRENVNKLDNSSHNLSEISKQMSDGAGGVSDRSNTVAAAAEEMSSNMDSVAAATEQASTNVSLVATAAEEMTATINEITQNTEKARHISDEAVRESKAASEKVDELGSAAHEIGKVTQTITEISEQTNLLALNATIEAARAGEAGKGFAVVANEIKELAKQTAEATEEIKRKITSIQGSADGTVAQIVQISKVINEVSEIVSTIATAVEEQSVTTREIANNVVQASQGVNEVTENVACTSTVTGEVAKDITEVNQAANEMTENSAQVSQNAQELAGLATQLNEMVAQFKV